MILKDNHFILTASSDINEICRPLFLYTPITHFEFARIYKDGSRAWLTSNAKRTQHLFNHDYQESTDYKLKPTVAKSDYLLWSEGHLLLDEEGRKLYLQKVAYGKELFNVANGISIFEHTYAFDDHYNFGTTAENTHMNTFYLTEMETLKKFILYFKSNAASLIKLSALNKIIMPKLSHFHPNSSELSNSTSFEQFDREKFNESIKINNYLITTKNKEVFLTLKQTQCLVKLAKGQSIKQIAQALSLSPRTIETHINHIKEKLDLVTTAQLIDAFWESNLVDPLIMSMSDY